jgi:hypothetical protein
MPGCPVDELDLYHLFDQMKKAKIYIIMQRIVKEF